MSSLRRASGFAADASSGAPLRRPLAALRHSLPGPAAAARLRAVRRGPLAGLGREPGRAPGHAPARALARRARARGGAARAPGLSRGEVVVETGDRAAAGRASGTPRGSREEPRAPAPRPPRAPTRRGSSSCAASGRTARFSSTARRRRPCRRSSPSPRCASPAGRHRIEWREEVPGLAVSRWGPVLFALAVRGPARRRRPAEDARS